MGELRHKDVWNSEYRNVRYEIMRWRLGGNCDGSHIMWNYYLYLPIEQIPEKARHFFILHAEKSTLPSGRYYFNYSGRPVIDELDWHGGLTFYEKEYGVRREFVGVKLGCDYGHHFDEQRGYPYTVEYVDREARHTIDKLHELMPNLKIACSWNGKFHDRSEGAFNEYGVFTSFEGKTAEENFHKENQETKPLA